MILLLCGLSIAVKTTIAYAVKNKLEKESIYIGIIDADLYSGNISKNLGFSKENRCKNIRRLEVVAQLFCAQHIIPIITAITPYEIMRQEFSAAQEGVKIIHIDCRLSALILRDTKGLYRRAFLSDSDPLKIKNITGANDPFERPEKPDLYINTDNSTVGESALLSNGFIKHTANLQ